MKACFSGVNGDRSELKRILLSLQFLIISILGLLVFTLLDIFFGLLLHVIFDLVMLSSFILAFYLIKTNHLKAGKLLLFISGNSILLLIASSQGRNAGNIFIFFPLLTGIFTLFSYREWPLILFCTSITFANFIFLEWTDYAFLKKSSLPISYEYITYLAAFCISMAMIGYFTYYHTKANSETESKLKLANLHLKKRNKALVKTNSELDSFVYKASHDLRAPLTSLLGLINLSHMESDLETMKNYVGLQQKLIHKLDSYIADILTLSRNAHVEVEISPIDFEQTIHYALEQLKYLDNFTQVHTTIQLPRQGVAFYSDQKRIATIFNNLLSNAFRYADPAKQKSRLHIELQFQAKQAIIIVADNGIGIGSTHLNKIFDMFYRGTDRNTGSGLGLYIVREIVERLQGRIQVNSQLGEGARFEISLPSIGGEKMANNIGPST